MKRERTGQTLRFTIIISIAILSYKTVSAQKAYNENSTRSTITNTTVKTEIKELKIGDKVPDFEFALINYRSSRAKLSDFTGKYIILDFWATWCTACLHNFPKLDSLQKKYAEQLQVLLVNTKDTRDDENKLATFFSKRKNPRGERYQLPSVFNDTIARKLFPHRGIPHYVWIDNKNAVRAITSSEEITPENIATFISGKSLNLPIKIELDYDFQKPLFVNGNGGENEKYIYRSILTSFVKGLPGSSGIIVDSNTHSSRIFILNASKLLLYMQAYPEMGKYYKNRIILDLKDKASFTNDLEIDALYYCYETVIPISSREKVQELMQEDLKRYFGLKASIVKRKATCLVFRAVNPEKSKSKERVSETNIFEKDSSPKYIKNYPIFILTRYLNYIIDTPVIDETNFSDYVSMELPTDLTDIVLLRKALNKNGFTVIEEQRELEFFVISENSK